MKISATKVKRIADMFEKLGIGALVTAMFQYSWLGLAFGFAALLISYLLTEDV